MSINPFGHVYVVQGDQGPVKIGITTDPHKRLSAIQSSSGRLLVRVWVSAAVCNPRSIEARLHAKFWAHRSAGEWFDVQFDLAMQAASELCEPAALMCGAPSGDYLRGVEIRQQLQAMAARGMTDAASLSGFAAALSDDDVNATCLSIRADAEAWESLLASIAGILDQHGVPGREIVGQAADAILKPD